MQTDTLAIRGLSLGVGIRRVAGRELLTGALLGLTLAGLAFPIVWAGWGEVGVAAAVIQDLLTVSIYFLTAVTIAT